MVGNVCAISIGHVHVNSKIFNLKEFFKALINFFTKRSF